MKKLLVTNILTATASITLFSATAYAQKQTDLSVPPSPQSIPANPPWDNKLPTLAEEKAETAQLRTKRAELLKNGTIKPSDLPPQEQNNGIILPSAPVDSPIDKQQSAETAKFSGTSKVSPVEIIKKQQELLEKQQKMIVALAQAKNNAAPQPASSTPPANVDKLFFNPADNLPLNEDENVSLKQIQTWNAGTAVKPIIGKNGSVEFTFGAQIPSILCAPMQVTDLQLQPGEKVTNVNIGDAARWKIDPAVTGKGDNAAQHLMIKPLENGLQTSLVIATDKRTYHLSLKSHLTKFMPFVTFFYADEAEALIKAKLEKQKAAEIKEKVDNTIPETGEYLGNLDFHYCIKGNAPWKPLRVYNDGRKTMIDLPDSVRNSAVPTLLINEPYSKTPGLVNSRLVNNRFIVDQIFNKAQLIVGVGKYQKKTIIKKGNC